MGKYDIKKKLEIIIEISASLYSRFAADEWNLKFIVFQIMI